MIKGVFLLSMLAILGTGFVGFRYATPGEETYEIEYKVTCQQCNITYRNERGESAEVTGIKDNWTYKFMGNPGQFVYVSATNDNGKPVKVLIKRAGRELVNGASKSKDLDARAGVILQPINVAGR